MQKILKQQKLLIGIYGCITIDKAIDLKENKYSWQKIT